jgi:hypothetical protein
MLAMASRPSAPEHRQGRCCSSLRAAGPSLSPGTSSAVAPRTPGCGLLQPPTAGSCCAARAASARICNGPRNACRKLAWEPGEGCFSKLPANPLGPTSCWLTTVLLQLREAGRAAMDPVASQEGAAALPDASIAACGLLGGCAAGWDPAEEATPRSHSSWASTCSN